MEAVSELLGFVTAIGDEISNIVLGDGDAEEEQVLEEPIRPVVIAGPSGVGKGTLIELLMKEYPEHFGFSISHTTRDPRPQEVNGVHYHFSNRSDMATMIDANEFLESADVHGNYYGTSKAAVNSVTKQNKICILDIDIQGVQQVRAANLEPSPIFIFINPPSLEELESRLRGRGTETEEKIQKRLATARTEMGYAAENDGDNFDHVFVNEKLDDCFESIKTYIGPDLDAVTRERAKANASDSSTAPPPAAEETKPPAATITETAVTPSLADQIKAKEAELDAANAVKDRVKAAKLLAELTELEAALEAK